VHGELADTLRLLLLLQALVSDAVLSGDRFKVGSDVHRLKVRAWQGLTAAANFLGSSMQRDTAAAAVKGELLWHDCPAVVLPSM
jgi:hypothetical protein